MSVDNQVAALAGLGAVQTLVIANARKKEREQRGTVLFLIGLVSFDALRSWKLFDADAGTDTAREVREHFIPDFSEWRDKSKYDQCSIAS